MRADRQRNLEGTLKAMPGTAKELAARTELGESTVFRVVKFAIEAGLAHVSGKAYNGRATIPSSIYTAGPRPSGLRPTNAVYVRHDPPTMGPPHDPYTLPLFPDEEPPIELERAWHPRAGEGASRLAY